jgi:uncharacterized protein YegL
LSKKEDDLTKQLKALNQNIDALIKVTAISIGKESIFKGKDTIEEKVDVLDKMGLSNELIAIITGSKSAHSISQIKSRMNPTRPKDVLTESKAESPQQEQVEKNDEQ